MIGLPAFFATYHGRVSAEIARLVDGSDPVERAMAYTASAPSKQVRAVLTIRLRRTVWRQRRAGDARSRGDRARARRIPDPRRSAVDGRRAVAERAARRIIWRSANPSRFWRRSACSTLPTAHSQGPTSPTSRLVSRPSRLMRSDPTASSAGRHSTCWRPISRSASRCSSASIAARPARSSSRPLRPAPSLPALEPKPIAALAAYAKNLGLAFQIVDDLLDVEGDPAQTGKAVREDARKTTFVSFSGVHGARQLAAELCETADRALVSFGPRADRLRELSAFVAARRL